MLRLLGIIVLTAFLATVGLAARSAGARASATAARFPAPPANATVYARQFGNDALALAVVPQRGNAVRVEASVVGRQGNGVPGLRLTFRVAGLRKLAVACGAGCYRATFPTGRLRPRSVDVTVSGSRNGAWHVALPGVWPPRPGGGPRGARGSRLALTRLADVQRDARLGGGYLGRQHVARPEARSRGVRGQGRLGRSGRRDPALGPGARLGSLGAVVAVPARCSPRRRGSA